MTILITGGSGFVGLSLAEALLPTRRPLVLFGREPMPSLFEPLFPKTRFLAGDITDSDDVDRLLQSVKPATVVHLAAVTPDRTGEMHDPAGVTAVNIGGTATVMRSISRLEQRPRLIVASSVAIYGEEPPASGRYDEDHPAPKPTSLYGISKLASEAVAIRLASLYDIELAIARLGPTYGPWEHQTGLRPVLSPHAQVLEIWKRGEDVILPRALRGDWLYSRDAGRGLAALASAERLHHVVYNLGGGSMTTLSEWCEALQGLPAARGWRLAEPDETPNLLFGLARDRAPLNIERIRADVGFAPIYSGAVAANDYQDWLRTGRQ